MGTIARSLHGVITGDGPFRLHAGLRRHQFFFSAMPFRFHGVAALTIDSFFGEFRWRKRRILGELEIGSQLAFDTLVYRGFIFFVPELMLAKIFLIPA